MRLAVDSDCYIYRQCCGNDLRRLHKTGIGRMHAPMLFQLLLHQLHPAGNPHRVHFVCKIYKTHIFNPINQLNLVLLYLSLKIRLANT